MSTETLRVHFSREEIIGGLLQSRGLLFHRLLKSEQDKILLIFAEHVDDYPISIEVRGWETIIKLSGE